MILYRINYMVDPGGGIVSSADFETDTDDMAEALVEWFNLGFEYFVVKCEIVKHPNMV